MRRLTYSEAEKQKAARRFAAMNQMEREKLVKNIIAGLPGGTMEGILE